MVQIEFTEKEIESLKYERFHHPHPRVQQKMEAVLLKSKKLSHQQIAEIIGVSSNTVTHYLKDYKQGGLDKLKEINFNKPKSELNGYISTIEAYFKEHPPATIKEAGSKIEELTGLRRSIPQVCKFLKSIGLNRRKVGMIPSKADLEEQEKFKRNKLEPRLEEAKAGKRKVYCMDAVHFVLAPFLGYLWSFTRLFIKAPAGRKRYNVLGALDVITHELIPVTNDTYINAESVCSLLRLIYNHSIGIPITIILDNARYQKCKVVKELAELLNIELLYLPAYSPNLNLIERLWKFVKKKSLYSKYYDEFVIFKNAIDDCLNRTHTEYKKELDSLLTHNFQTFEESQIMTF